MKTKIIAGLVIATALFVSNSAYAFTNNPNDGARFFTQDGHRYYGFTGSVNLVGVVLPDMAAPVVPTMKRSVAGNICHIWLVGKVPTAQDILNIKALTCTKYIVSK